MVFLAFTQSAVGYNPIENVDDWDATRLKEAGVVVTTWKHERMGENPPLDWVQISFDTSKRPKDSDVLMTLHVVTDNGKIVSAHRAEMKAGKPKKMAILFAVQKEYVENSSLQILTIVPESRDEVASRNNPGFGGYSLSLSRIVELAHLEWRLAISLG